MQLCDICKTRVADKLIETPIGTEINVCFVCNEVKYLLDGIGIDLRIDYVESLVINEPSGTSFSRGFTAIN